MTSCSSASVQNMRWVRSDKGNDTRTRLQAGDHHREESRTLSRRLWILDLGRLYLDEETRSEEVEEESRSQPFLWWLPSFTPTTCSVRRHRDKSGRRAGRPSCDSRPRGRSVPRHRVLAQVQLFKMVHVHCGSWFGQPRTYTVVGRARYSVYQDLWKGRVRRKNLIAFHGSGRLISLGPLRCLLVRKVGALNPVRDQSQVLEHLLERDLLSSLPPF